MGLPMHLTAEDLTRCEEASHVLLSPLAAPTLDDWCRAIAGALRLLLHADRAVIGIPTESGYVHAENVDDATLAAYQYYVETSLVEGAGSPDPLCDLFARRRRALGVEVYNPAMADRILDGKLSESGLYNDVWVGRRLFDVHALHTTLPTADGAIDMAASVSYEHPGRVPFGGEALPVLRMLLPAFKAGLHALRRLHAHRAFLDELPEPLAVFDVDGSEQYRNAALTRLLASDPQGGEVMAAAHRLARSRARHTFLNSHEEPLEAPLLSMSTAHGRYTLRAALLGLSPFGQEGGVVVTVSRAAVPALPTADALRERYGLTRREAEVALLLAEGYANAEIAERLFISPHTARRHTEQVFGKLGLNTRKALAMRLLKAA